MSKATTIDQLKKLATRTGLEVKEIRKKVEAIKVPTAVSELTNDSNFQSDTQVSAAIQTAIAATGHAHFEKVDAVPSAGAAQENVLYLVMNAKSKHYDIYALVGGEVVQLDDTTVDLGGYVEKVEGKGLSTNDYTNDDKAKLDAIEFATDEEVDAILAEAFGAAE